MGFIRERVRSDGEVRYQAHFIDVRGRQRSAGTYASVDKAKRAWQRAEEGIASGRLGDAQRGRQKLQRYVEDEWLPHHQMEARTRENYTYYFCRYIQPTFGSMRMVEILPTDVRQWVADLKRDGTSPTVIRSCFAILSGIFTTAFNDQITHLHPCRGVKTPPVPKKLRTIVTPDQFDKIYAALSNDAARLLVELDVESGLRWGELTELRPADINLQTRIMTVRRVVVELVPTLHNDGKRFVIKEYPKDREHRRLKLSPHVIDAIEEYVDTNGISASGLLFRIDALKTVREHEGAAASSDLGLTEPNATGRQYAHGTTTAYDMAPCRCEHCRQAYAAYRAARRTKGKDSPRNPRRQVNTDGHIPRRWFRQHIWLPALERADLKIHVRPHDLRHAHASWLLAGGADLQVVKERLGHGTIKTTEQYLHTLEDADETALDALSAVRKRSGRR
jgi:integrase